MRDALARRSAACWPTGGSRSTGCCWRPSWCIVGAGLLLSLAASPAIAIKRGLPTFYFVERHFVFALAGVVLMLAVSLLSPPAVRRLALAVLLVACAGLMVLVLMVGTEINGARRWLHIGGYSLQPSEFAKPAFVVLSAWLFAEAERRPDMPAMALAVLLYAAVRRPARAAARCRPDAAGEPGVGRAVPAGRAGRCAGSSGCWRRCWRACSPPI